MPRRHPVLALAAAAALAGCGDDAPATDAGCASPRTADVVPASLCVAPGGVLRVTVDGCFCGSTLACDAALRGDTLAITTRSATCGTMCAACEPLLGECRLPAGLAPSRSYRVEVNGRWALDVSTDASGGLPASSCFDPAGEVPSAFACADERLAVAAESACVPAYARAGSSVYVSATACVPCGATEAGCEVVRDGSALHVTPFYRGCTCATCGACAGTCEVRTFACALPPLENGTVYAVDLGGRAGSISVSATGTGNTDCATP